MQTLPSGMLALDSFWGHTPYSSCALNRPFRGTQLGLSLLTARHGHRHCQIPACSTTKTSAVPITSPHTCPRPGLQESAAHLWNGLPWTRHMRGPGLCIMFSSQVHVARASVRAFLGLDKAHRVDGACFVHPLVRWCTLAWLPLCGHCEQGCCGHPCMAQSRGVAESAVPVTCNVSSSRGISPSPCGVRPRPHSLAVCLSVCLVITGLAGVTGLAGWVCISLMASDGEQRLVTGHLCEKRWFPYVPASQVTKPRRLRCSRVNDRSIRREGSCRLVHRRASRGLMGRLRWGLGEPL